MALPRKRRMARHTESTATRQCTGFDLYSAKTANSTREQVVEVKSPDCNKGSEVERLLANRRYDFVMAMGDDTTDEDMFQALPAKAVTIKIGNVSKAANYNLPAQSDVLPFLQSMLRKQKNPDNEKLCQKPSDFRFQLFQRLIEN